MTADLSADLPATACRGKVRTERGHGAGEAEGDDGSHTVFSWETIFAQRTLKESG